MRAIPRAFTETENDPNNESIGEQKRSALSLRTQLLLYVNSVLAVAVMLFLILDYREEYRSRLEEKQIALTEEARALLPAVWRLRHHGTDEIQSYLDEVCGSMREEQSPGHHIAVRLDGLLLQALAHHRASPQMLSAMERALGADDHQTKFDDRTMLVGSARRGSNIVFVSEFLENLHHAIMVQLLWRTAGMGLLALVAGAVVNMVLLRLVARPIESLAKTVEHISQGQLGIDAKGQTTAELAYLANSITAMSHSLAKSERERLGQFEKARRIQQHLLPNSPNTHEIKLSHLYEPATDIAGDFFDVVQMPEGSWLFCIADVTGHGIAAAMGAVVLKSVLLEAAEKDRSLITMLSYINDRFGAVSLPDDFATMVLARWSPEKFTLEYASAGHETAYFFDADSPVHELRSTGIPLGIDKTAGWESEILTADNGGRLFLFTDGLVETRNGDGELFGRQRLFRLLSQTRNGTVESVVGEVKRELNAYCEDRQTDDDVTFVAIDFGKDVRISANATDTTFTSRL